MAIAPSLPAQELEISASPTPIGSGARAAGMADAFVAIADDATAASWNPAGLVQLERPELSVVGAYNSVLEWFQADYHEEFEGSHYTDNLDLNYMSAAFPLPKLVLGRNICVSLNYQHKYDFSRAFDFDLNRSDVAEDGRSLNDFLHFAFKQDGGLSTITPAVAFEITHRISLGAALNFWQPTFLNDNSWEQTTKTRQLTFSGSSVFLSNFESQENYKDFTGQNLTLGGLWTPTDRLSFGLRYDTAFTGNVSYRLTQMNAVVNVGSGSYRVKPKANYERRHVRFPASLALGAAWRANDRLTLSMDVTRTDWNDFYVKTEEGNRRSLVDFSNLDEPWTRTHFEPTYTVRLGTEYVFLPKEPEENLGRLWTLRGGLFFDQEPATAKSSGFRRPGDNGSGKPDNFYGCALGVGVLLGQRVNIDAAWQLRYGPGVNRDFIRGIPGFKEDVLQQRVLLSTVVYF
jgi:long-subunit fatty acid transport protein